MELNKWTFNWYGADKMINKDVLVEVKVSSMKQTWRIKNRNRSAAYYRFVNSIFLIHFKDE